MYIIGKQRILGVHQLLKINQYMCSKTRTKENTHTHTKLFSTQIETVVLSEVRILKFLWSFFVYFFKTIYLSKSIKKYNI